MRAEKNWVITERNVTQDYVRDKIPSDTTHIVLENVQSIEDYAFSYCSRLTQIDIPEGVESIGSHIFYGCSSLRTINMPDSHRWYIPEATENLTEEYIKSNIPETALAVIIPEGVKTIEREAFSCCTSLVQIDMPESLESIQDMAFQECSSLLQINIPKGVRFIGEEAFAECGTLREIELQEGIEDMKDHVFSGCSGLQVINMPDSYIWHIPPGIENLTKEYIEANMPKVTLEVVIPEGVRSIGAGAFEGYSNLIKIEIPSGVTSIGDSAFSGCACLMQIDIPEEIESIQNTVFKGCSSLWEIKIPVNVNSIGDSAFEDCTSLEKIKISENIARIGDGAFENCISLEKIEIEEGADEITLGIGLLTNCSNLTQIEIPARVTSIGHMLFLECTKLTSVILPDQFCTEAEKSRLGIEEEVSCISHSELLEFCKGELKIEGAYNFEKQTSLYRLSTDMDFTPGKLKDLKDCTVMDVVKAIKYRHSQQVEMCMESDIAGFMNCLLGESRMNKTVEIDTLLKIEPSGMFCLDDKVGDHTSSLLSYLTVEDFKSCRECKAGLNEQSLFQVNEKNNDLTSRSNKKRR